jgi:hypothetical protein
MIAKPIMFDLAARLPSDFSGYCAFHLEKPTYSQVSEWFGTAWIRAF